jgi:hypothetical protein
LSLRNRVLSSHDDSVLYEGTTWEKVWEDVAGTPPRQCVDGITLATYKHWMAASPVVDEITGIAKNDNWY